MEKDYNNITTIEVDADSFVTMLDRERRKSMTTGMVLGALGVILYPRVKRRILKAVNDRKRDVIIDDGQI